MKKIKFGEIKYLNLKNTDKLNLKFKKIRNQVLKFLKTFKFKIFIFDFKN